MTVHSIAQFVADHASLFVFVGIAVWGMIWVRSAQRKANARVSPTQFPPTRQVADPIPTDMIRTTYQNQEIFTPRHR
jgi:hypothetical protein